MPFSHRGPLWGGQPGLASVLASLRWFPVFIADPRLAEPSLIVSCVREEDGFLHTQDAVPTMHSTSALRHEDEFNLIAIA